MHTCSTCRHWKRYSGPLSDMVYAYCARGSSEFCEPDDKTSRAYATGGDGGAALLTYPDFGCIQWEARR